MKVVILKNREKKLKPADIGKRNIDELFLQMKLFVQFLKKKGLRVIWKS